MASPRGSKPKVAKKEAKRKTNPPATKPEARPWQPHPDETIGQKAIRWHHSIAQVTGALSLRITKASLLRSEIRQWIEILENVAKEMKETTQDDRTV